MNKASHGVAFVLAVVVFLSATGRASADIIDVDINGIFDVVGPTQTAVAAGENWYGLNIPLLGGNGPISATFAGIGVTLAGTDANGLQGRDRGLLNFGTTLSGLYADLFRDFGVGYGQAGPNLSLDLTGLTPNTLYDIRLQSYDSVTTGSISSLWTDTTAGGLGNSVEIDFQGTSDPSASLLNDSGLLTVQTDASGALQLIGSTLSSPEGVRLNGFEILSHTDANPVPAPGTLVMLTSGVLCLVGRARFRKQVVLA